MSHRDPYAKLSRIGLGAILFLMCLGYSLPSEAYYRKKVDIKPLTNIAGWKGTYDPGNLIAEILAKKIRSSQLLIVSPSKSDAMMMEKDENKASMNGPAQFVVTGTIREFSPAKIKIKKSFEERKRDLKKTEKLSARATVEYEIHDGFSGRVIWSQELTGHSLNGEIPLGFSAQSLDPTHSDFHRTAMGQVLDKLTSHFIEKFFAFSNEAFLDGQIVSLDINQGMVVINLGEWSGVEVGDTFNIFKVTPKYVDPLHKNDLGHWYKKSGVIRIREVQGGFALAAIRAGENFQPGDVVRSKIINSIPEAIETAQMSQIQETETEPAEAKKGTVFSNFVRKHSPRKTLAHIDVMGDAILTLAY